MKRAISLVVGLVLGTDAFAQQGDVGGEDQSMPTWIRETAARPPLTPDEALRAFTLAPGVTIELVAAEPLVRDPVAMSFSVDGRLWVAEMSGYMRDLSGSDEAAPTGCIAVLNDEDGDGRMDARSVFADGLVLPRALALVRGGVLVIANGELVFLVDSDDDGVADERNVVDRGLSGVVSPEHAINGLLPTLDNALACANAPWRYVWRDRRFQREGTAGGGQWGITQDDRGRLFHNNNSDPLRYDRIPSRYASRNPNLPRVPGVDERAVASMSVFPSHATPGVNRGYRKDFLVDGKLREFTAACAPWIHRGGGLGPRFEGAAFVAEPAANLVAAFELSSVDGRVAGEALRDAGREFLCSSDERFRPVFVCDGPDGALYVADMYRGLIQHRLFVTSFLAEQVRARGLETPIGHGRIWRLRAGDSPRTTPPDVSESTWMELASLLESPNGWWRDRIQQIFVEEGEGETKARAALEVARRSTNALTRVHALWALSALRGLSREIVIEALSDPDERVRETAVRVGEAFASGDSEILARWSQLRRDASASVRAQVWLSLGELVGEDADRARLAWILDDASSAEVRAWLLSGLCSRERAFLAAFLARPDAREELPGRAELVRELALGIAREAGSVQLPLTLDLILESGRTLWQREALIRGLLDGRIVPAKGRAPRLNLLEEPRAFVGLSRLAECLEPKAGESLRELLAALVWPGRAIEGEVATRALTERERASFERGRGVFTTICAGCHQLSGEGLASMAPPLRGSDWVLGDPERTARIVLGGLNGPIEVRGTTWSMDMPAVVASDEDIAGVLTYLRREWGHGADPVDVEFVRRVRAKTAARKQPWTAAELEALSGQ